MLDKAKADVDALIAANPKVDGERVRAGFEALEELRRAGLAREQGYEILSPYTRPHPGKFGESKGAGRHILRRKRK